VRADNTLFATDNVDGSKQPRYVVSIDFDGTLQHLSSHDDIANVPTALAVIQNAIVEISATSQTLNPDRANATIGSMSFDIVDLANAFTNVVRTQLTTNNIGLRGRTVQFFVGYKSEQDGAGILDGTSTGDNPDFDNFVLFQTQVIQAVETKEGKYSIKCTDIQRTIKKQIFKLAQTYLTASIAEAATTIPVLDLSGFEGNVHGTSYSDAPGLDVIYIRIDSTKEIISCPTADIVGNSFTNVTRGALQTTAQAVEVNLASASDRRPKVEEYVYLELPAVKLAYAVLTGVIEGTANVLPGSWHAAVPTAFVRLADFKAIGDDLWVPTDDTAGVILRFDGIEKQDAKTFLETELYLLLGLFSPVYADGQLGLKRMVPSLSDSPYQFEINNSNVIGSGNLRHDMGSMQNNLRVDWNWNGDRYIRSTIIVDSLSIAKHGQALEKRMSFRGLVGTRFTEQVLRQLLTSLRDMYTGPPLRLDINGFHLMNPLEVGDAVRVNLSNIRDYSQAGSNLVRTMVVHGMTVDWLKGVKLKLFGSSERADEIPPITATICLPDAFYSQEGTALSGVLGLMTGNVTNAGTFTLVGDADMNAAGAIFYHAAPLTISSTTTLNIEQNVQLRVKGFLTINGSIIGTGQGHISGVDTFLVNEHYYFRNKENFGVQGFIGNSKTHGGLLIRQPDDGGEPSWVWVTTGYFTQGRFDSFPNLILEVDDAGNGSIIGIPTDMRGGGGAFGQRAGLKIGLAGRTHMKSAGGSGGAGGAALCVVCRGGDFGIAGEIRLDGADSIQPTTFFISSNPIFHTYGGAGGAGSPGAMLWLIDGSGQTFPDLAGHFFALTGDVPAQFALPLLDGPSQHRSLVQQNAPLRNMAPFMADRISGFDQSGVNFRISFLPCDVTPTDDQHEIVPPPISLIATPVFEGVQLSCTIPESALVRGIEIHASDTNVRSTAVIISRIAAPPYREILRENPRRRFYWMRTRGADKNVSRFEPDTSTTTATAAPRAPATNILIDPDFDKSAAAFAGGFWTTDVKPGTGPTQTGSVSLIVGAGTNGSNAVDIISSGGTGSRSALIGLRRHRINAGNYEFRITYKTQTNTFFDKHELEIGVEGFSAETGGTRNKFGSTKKILARSTAAFLTVSLFFHVPESDASQFYRFFLSDWPATSTLDTLRIDSIFIYPTSPKFGDNVVDTILSAGLVPDAPAADAAKVLQGDGTWVINSGPVDSFNGRTGAVVPLQADYDGFFLTPAEGDALFLTPAEGDALFLTPAEGDALFLTPAEGDAAYSMLGHLHDGIADANLLNKSANENVFGIWQFLNTAGIVSSPSTGNASFRAGADDQNLIIIFGNSFDNSLNPTIRGWGATSATPNQLDLSVPNGGDIDLKAITAGTVTMTNITSLIAGSTDADFDAITGTSYGGILEANLLDRTASANIANNWNWQDNSIIRALMDDFAVRHQVVTGVASTTINYTTGQSVLLNLDAASITTLTITNWPATSRLGQLEIEVTQGVTPRTIAWDTAIAGTVGWPEGIAPNLNVANGRFLINLRSRDAKTTLIGTFAENFS